MKHVITAVLFVVGTALATYLNFMWAVGLLTGFITHIKATPIDSSAVAYDIAMFLFRGAVFFVTLVVCNLPAVIFGSVVASRNKHCHR